MAQDKEIAQLPWIAFTSFRSAIQGLRDHGLPPVLDRSAWNTRSGTEQTQIVGALKFFKLIDSSGNTQDSLKDLVKASENSDEERTIWNRLLSENYIKVFSIDLASATPKQLEDAIGESGLTGATKQKAIRFFLKAALHAKVQLSTRLTMKLRERAATDAAESDTATDSSQPRPSAPKARRKRRQNGTPAGSIPIQPPPPPGSSSNAMKTIKLPKVGGSLSIAGTFNAFQLMGDERELVYKIIDLMTDYEAKTGTDL